MRFTVSDTTATGSSLWELSRNGALHPLLTDWKGAGTACCGDWTADGRYYLFRSNGQIWYVSDGSWLSDTEPALLTTSGTTTFAAAPNPMGKTAFVSAALGVIDIFKWDLKANRTSLLYSELKLVSLEFSRDGQWIAYSHKASTGYELWRARANGSEKLQLTAPLSWIYLMRYSPDGRKIAIMASRPNGPWKIYWVSADGGALHEIPSPATNQADPTWSPDSQSIMFGLPPEQFGDPGVPRQLYRYDLRTNKTSEVPGSTGLFSPRWSPDGRYIVAISVDFQGMSVLDMAPAKWRPLALHSIDSPSWSPDSAWIYVNHFTDTDLWRVRVTDGRVEAVSPTPLPSGYSSCRARAFGPDGAMLLDCRDSRVDIFALNYKD